VQSKEPLKVLFHPACLLTMGDALAFVRGLSSQAQVPTGPQRARGQAGALPPMEEQMGITVPVTARVPQRYLIQNQTGMALWYWRPAADGSSRGQDPVLLQPTGCSEELKVVGAAATCTTVAWWMH
jgi:hypothetical protein